MFNDPTSPMTGVNNLDPTMPPPSGHPGGSMGQQQGQQLNYSEGNSYFGWLGRSAGGEVSNFADLGDNCYIGESDSDGFNIFVLMGGFGFGDGDTVVRPADPDSHCWTHQLQIATIRADTEKYIEDNRSISEMCVAIIENFHTAATQFNTMLGQCGTFMNQILVRREGTPVVTMAEYKSTTGAYILTPRDMEDSKPEAAATAAPTQLTPDFNFTTVEICEELYDYDKLGNVIPDSKKPYDYQRARADPRYKALMDDPRADKDGVACSNVMRRHIAQLNNV